ncbi:hypothetical protein CRP01_21095 [Flavilitoribacter nigricans DSM 23189 = NBRC 102662]|uniref:Uncharacterized protein n=1 Tax=Flavilitoribacter nigricans (strain ATCC 23147 / DSM 23189 / NBRC 102662 / NCIMB 1420 / SS-2) TaxID=1122177 RepID=A0A2D0N7L1_FLAN2|nr:hypothetical protein CRP01_21095 [Flavilitoribacter nigricans DSM 23189 = NBRC 102662]
MPETGVAEAGLAERAPLSETGTATVVTIGDSRVALVCILCIFAQWLGFVACWACREKVIPRQQIKLRKIIFRIIIMWF